jgi:hypothetical protein
MRPAWNKAEHKYSTVDATYKLIGSLPPPRGGCNVATMDKFVSTELQGKVINERHDVAAATTLPSRSLGYFLDLIFASFSKVFADVTPESLTVPLSSLPHAARQCISSYKTLSESESESVELYDKKNRRWQWNLPLTEPPPEQPVNATPGPAEPSDIELEPLSAEWQVALFLNSIAEAFAVN